MRFQQIYDWIEVHKPKVILEVGTWNGINATHLMREGATKYIGFDIWDEGDETLDELENNAKKRVSIDVARETLKQFDIELIQGNTRDTLKEYVKGKKPFVDVALIDGGHSKGTIKNDLLHVMQIVKPNGVIFLDDYYFNCSVSGIGAQSVMVDLNVPYTVLPKADKARGNMIVKIARLDMKDVPKPHQWEVPEDQSWKFKPEAAA